MKRLVVGLWLACSLAAGQPVEAEECLSVEGLELCRNGTALRFVAGEDRLEITLEDDGVRATVNGVGVRIARDELTPERLPPRIEPLSAALVDPERFAADFALASEKFDALFLDDLLCGFTCFMCGVYNYEYSTAAVVGSCVGLVMIGPSGLPTCSKAIDLYALAAGTCAECLDCLGGGSPTPPECPPGSHECCEGQCCLDGIPEDCANL